MSRHGDRRGQIAAFRDSFETINWLYLLFECGIKTKTHFEWLLWHWSSLGQLNLEHTRPNGLVGCKVSTDLVKISVKEATHMDFYYIPRYTCATVYWYHDIHVLRNTGTTIFMYHDVHVPLYIHVSWYTCTMIYMYHDIHAPRHTYNTIYMYQIYMYHDIHIPHYTCTTTYTYHNTHVPGLVLQADWRLPFQQSTP